MTVSDSWIPEVFSSFLLQSLKRAEVMALLPIPSVMNDPIIMICGRPWWLSWSDVTDAKPVKIKMINRIRPPRPYVNNRLLSSE